MRRTLPSSLQVLLDDARLGDFIPCILDANGQCPLSFFFLKRGLKWIHRSLAGREEQTQGPSALFLLLVHLRMTNHTHQRHLSLVLENRFDGNAAIPICVRTVYVLQSSICPFPENVCQAPSYLMVSLFEQHFDALVVHRRRSKEGRPVTEILFLHKKRLVGRVVVKSCEGFSTTRENEAKGGIYGEEEPRSLGGGTFLTATLFGGSRGHCFRRLFRSRSLRPGSEGRWWGRFQSKWRWRASSPGWTFLLYKSTEDPDENRLWEKRTVPETHSTFPDIHVHVGAFCICTH